MIAETLDVLTADVELGLFIITTLLFIVTAWLACLTYKLIKFQTDPYVYIDATWERLFLPPPLDGFPSYEDLSVHISIKNRGGSPARDVNIIDVRDDFPVGIDILKKTFRDSEIIEKGLKELAPDQDMLLARLVKDGAWRECPPSKIFFEYKTVSGKSKPGSSIIDFAALATVYESPAYHMK
jgi:hypothetical protein